MGRVRSDELRQDGLELETEIGEPLAENLIGGLSFLVGVRPRVDQGSNRLVAVEIPKRHLELVRGGSPPDARDANSVFPVLREPKGGEIGNAVGGDVFGGIPHLIDQLLLHARHTDPPAGAGMLGDLERPIRRRLHDRVADIREVRDPFPVHQAVASAALGAAFDRMTGDGACGEEIPGVGPPPEGVNHGRKGEPGIGDASRHDDVRAAAQRFHDRPGAEVGVRRDDPVAHVGQSPVSVEVPELVPAGQEPVQASQQIVPRYHADPELAAEPQAARDLGHRLRAAAGVHAARVGGDLDPPLRDDRQDALHQGDEVLGVPERRIARLLLLQDGHRDFGEIVHHEVVHRSAGHLAVRRLEPVAPEPLPRGDAHRGGARFHGLTTTRRVASGAEAGGGGPTDARTLTSTSGAKPSGKARSRGRWAGSGARPPGSTVISRPSPSWRGSLSRKRTRSFPRHGWTPLSRAKPGYNSTGPWETCCPVESNSFTPKSVNSRHCSRGTSTSTTAVAAQSGTETVMLSGGAPRPAISRARSAPSSTCVTRPLTLAGPGLVASRSARVSGASWARTVATAPERGGATTSSSYTPATASSARTTNRAVPTWDPPIGTIESRASSRNGAPLGSYRMALAVCCPESPSVTVATRVAPAGATRRKYRRTWPGPTERRSSNNGLSGRMYGTVTTLTSRNNGPARASLGFHAVTVPTYTPGAASAGAE